MVLTAVYHDLFNYFLPFLFIQFVCVYMCEFGAHKMFFANNKDTNHVMQERIMSLQFLIFSRSLLDGGYHINYGSFDLAVIHDMLYIIMRDSHKSKRLKSLSMSFGELSICDFLNDELAVNISQFVSIFSCEKLYLRL